VTLIGVTGTGPSDPSGRTEAYEVFIGPGGEVDPNAVVKIIKAVKPPFYTYKDARSHTD
jgi:hypothetical protein